MIHYTVVIPQRDQATAAGIVIARVVFVLEKLLLPYEILCVDDASATPTRVALEELLGTHERLRVLRFDEPRGVSGALTAGIAAARGDLVIAAHPMIGPNVRCIPHLIAHLSHSDLVVAEPERLLSAEIGHQVKRLARSVAGTADWRGSDELFWAARREAVAGLALARGGFRVLPALVAQRGYRVSRLIVSPDLPARNLRFRPGVVESLVAGWVGRRFEPHRASELPHAGLRRSWLRLARADKARGPGISRTTMAPAEPDRGEVA
jgi:hypothetical protein